MTRAVAIVAAGVCALLVVAHGGQFVKAGDRALHAGWQLVALAAGLEAASIAGYVLLLHRVVAGADRRLGLKDSYDMTLGGAAATRLLPTAGLGGAAVTVWALRARGVRAGELSARLLAFLLLLYSVYMAGLLASGATVAFGVVRVSNGRALGVLGAATAIAVAATILVLFAAPSRVVRAVDRIGRREGSLASASRGAVARLPVLHASLRRSWQELSRPHPALLGAVAYWAFDVGVLVTMLHAFGGRLPLAAIVLAYFLGTMFNVVPLPGSLSGGLVGSLIALGCPAGSAIAAVLAYRALAVWLPAIPGVASLARLRASVADWRLDTDNRTLARQLPV
ncbi:MAG: flippase-like domain-containing protein [Solirubrobacterales bacterium]|nr:flippase-like domain-containing protein [Solirubrobacterales bacterium]